jgi:hypothetical protein
MSRRFLCPPVGAVSGTSLPSRADPVHALAGVAPRRWAGRFDPGAKATYHPRTPAARRGTAPARNPFTFGNP